MSKTLYAEFTVLPGSEEIVASLMASLTEQVRAEPGNQLFLPHTKAAEPNKYFVFEVYDDDAAFEAHINAHYGKTFNATLVEHIAEDGSQLTWLQ